MSSSSAANVVSSAPAAGLGKWGVCPGLVYKCWSLGSARLLFQSQNTSLHSFLLAAKTVPVPTKVTSGVSYRAGKSYACESVCVTDAVELWRWACASAVN